MASETFYENYMEPISGIMIYICNPNTTYPESYITSEGKEWIKVGCFYLDSAEPYTQLIVIYARTPNNVSEAH